MTALTKAKRRKPTVRERTLAATLGSLDALLSCLLTDAGARRVPHPDDLAEYLRLRAECLREAGMPERSQASLFDEGE